MPDPRPPRRTRVSLDSSPSDAQPFLLELAHRQAGRRTPADLLARFRADAFVRPSAVDQRELHLLTGFALDAAGDFDALQLSPVAPLGSCSVVAPTSQDRVLSAQRGTEVVSDPTNVLALECAVRLRRDPDRPVRLCTAHQLLRAQPLPPGDGFSQHFGLFAMAEAGRAEDDDAFEVRAVVRQMTVVDRIAARCEAKGYALPPRRFTVQQVEHTATLADRVVAALRAALPHVPIERTHGAARYYDGLRVRYDLAADTEPIPLGDLGRFDWVARLTSNRRLRFVAGGLGLQLLVARFGNAR